MFGLSKPLGFSEEELPAELLSPLMGRAFSAQEDSPASENVAILGHGSWERRFEADRGIAGRQIVLDGNPTTVVGVMPPKLELGLFRDVEIWTPLGYG